MTSSCDLTSFLLLFRYVLKHRFGQIDFLHFFYNIFRLFFADHLNFTINPAVLINSSLVLTNIIERWEMKYRTEMTKLSVK